MAVLIKKSSVDYIEVLNEFLENGAKLTFKKATGGPGSRVILQVWNGTTVSATTEIALTDVASLAEGLSLMTEGL